MELTHGDSLRRVLQAVSLILASTVLSELVSAAAAITRADIPEGFVFGAGTSAYQAIRSTMRLEMWLRTSITSTRHVSDFLKMLDDFTGYADVCFSSFGDRVKQWTTVNEANIEPIGGYDQGYLPPRRCSYEGGLDSHCWPIWYESETEKPEDREAAARANDFSIGWFMHPLVYGDYPPVMRRNVGSRLPELTPDEPARVRGSFDFVGNNQYSAILVEADLSQLKRKLRDYYGDIAAKFVTPPFQSSRNQLRSREGEAPWALSKMLEHLRTKYGNPPVVIYENGEFLYDDEFRSHFLQVYIEAALSSIRNGSDVCGYFMWSFLDVFEILFAYCRFRFGLFGVNFGDEQRTRYARNSARWYASFLHGGELRPVATGGDRTGFYSE
ncbi:hypothetical protein ACQ4PT_059767 [Festuca glaucescens]